MEFINRLKELTPKRWAGMFLGNLILAVGVCILKWSGTGNDPYTGMNMALGAVIGVSYGTFLIIINCFVFLVEIIWGRKYIGAGTLVNWFLIGPIVDDLYPWIDQSFGAADTLWKQLLLAVIGVIIISLACSVYQTSDAGIAPYDSLSIIGQERLHIPYFWCRMITDGICAVVCFLAHGVVGIGMLFCAFGLGPIISFFNKYISVPLIIGKTGKKGTMPEA